MSVREAGLQLLEIGSGRGRLVEGFRHAMDRPHNVLLRTTWGTKAGDDFAISVARGLDRRPRRLECRFLYDAHGSELYERITRQPEYYPTATEAGILDRAAADVRALTGPLTLLELGSGSSTKTSALIAAYLARDGAQRYVPVDVSEAALREASRGLTRRHRGLQVISVHGTYEMAVRLLPTVSPAMGVFLGSSIGNMDAVEEDLFWSDLARELPEGDYFLLGVDLVKDARVLNAAYNDAAGVTAAFTKNLFARMNRELGAQIDLGAIEHHAFFEPEREQVEIYARFLRSQVVHVAPLGRTFEIAAGEKVLVEISRKFRIASLTERLGRFGLAVQRVFTDPRSYFAVLLMRRHKSRAAGGVR